MDLVFKRKFEETAVCFSQATRGSLPIFFLFFSPAQVLRYFDYVFTGVFAFEMLIKVNRGEKEREKLSGAEKPPIRIELLQSDEAVRPHHRRSPTPSS